MTSKIMFNYSTLCISPHYCEAPIRVSFGKLRAGATTMQRLWFITSPACVPGLTSGAGSKWKIKLQIQCKLYLKILSLPSSVNKKLRRNKCGPRKLIQGSHCESQMHVHPPSSPSSPLSSPQPDGNSRLWHCHNFASLLLYSLFLPPPLSFQSRGAEVITCDTPHSGEKKGGKNCITPQSRMPWEQDEMYLLLLNNSGII